VTFKMKKVATNIRSKRLKMGEKRREGGYSLKGGWQERRNLWVISSKEVGIMTEKGTLLQRDGSLFRVGDSEV